MDAGDLINLVIFLAVFILPAVFKRLRGTAKKTVPDNKKTVSLFGRLNGAVRNLAAGLEQQILEARARQAEAGNQDSKDRGRTVWEDLAQDDGELPEDPMDMDDDAPLSTPAQRMGSRSPASSRSRAYRSRGRAAKRQGDMNMCDDQRPGQRSRRAQKACVSLPQLACTRYRSPLQQAVVWSEILGKPAALKDD